MNHPHRLLIALAAAAAGLGPSAAVATAQSDPGLFSVSPSRQVINARPPKRLRVFTVSNSTKVALAVKVFPAILDQQVSGQLIFSERQADLRGAATLVKVSPSTFELPSGTRRRVVATWAGLPSGAKVLNAGIVFQSVAKATGVVQTVQRLLTLNFLQLPGHYRSTGRFSLLRAEQGHGRTLDFIPRIENTGEIVQTPQQGRILVRDAAGDAVFRQRFVGDVILPAHERDFPVTMSKILQKGKYQLSASATFGDSGRIVARTSFTLVGPNQLPTPRVRLEQFAGHGEIGGDSEATGVVHSIGTLPADTAVKVQLFRVFKSGQRQLKPMKEQKLTYHGLAPDAKKNLKIVYPGLPAGTYRLIATYRDTPDTLAHLEADFAPTAPKKDSGSSALVPILGGLAIVAGGGLFFLFWRRRRKKDEEEDEGGQVGPAAAAAPPGAAPGAGGRVNLNTATVEELQQLPGVGPKAAARIIEHRDEYGRFGSLDELGRVEGFDAERIAGLEGRLTL